MYQGSGEFWFELAGGQQDDAFNRVFGHTADCDFYGWVVFVAANFFVVFNNSVYNLIKLLFADFADCSSFCKGIVNCKSAWNRCRVIRKRLFVEADKILVIKYFAVNGFKV